MPKGGKRQNAGRPKGKQNKATKEARQAIAKFVDENSDRLQKWLDDIADEDPKGAFDRFMSVVEYHVPKLSRIEQQALNKDGEPADHSIKIEFVDAKNSDK